MQPGGDPTDRKSLSKVSWIVIAVILGMGATLFLVMRSGRTLRDQVRAKLDETPQDALQLIDQAIDDAGGTYPDAQVMKCEVLGDLRGWREAATYFRSIDSPEACDQAVLMDLAIAANDDHAAWLAEKVLIAANRPGPERERVIRLLMRVQYDLGKMGAVLSLCKELTQLAPEDPEPWLVSAGIHHSAEQLGSALRDYQEAISRSPPASEALRVRLQIAEVSLHLGDLVTAGQQIQILRALAPGEPPVGVVYAKLLRRQGEIAKAKAVVSEVIAKAPQFANALLLRAEIRNDEGELRAAEADLLAVLQLDPFHQPAHYQLGQVYQRLKMAQESEYHLQESHRLTDAMSEILFLGRQLDSDPNSRELRLRLAEQHRAIGDAQSADHWERLAEDLR